MSSLILVTALVFGLWIAVNSRTRRRDATWLRDVHPYRQMLLYISPRRNDSTFQAELDIPAANLLAFLDSESSGPNATVSHVALAALLETFHQVPQMNRFVSGGRLYQRNDVRVAFSMKRAKLDAKAKVSVVQILRHENEPFVQLCERVNGEVNRERTGEKTYADKEFDLFQLLPHALLKKAPGLMSSLDAHNLLPHSFTCRDPLYSSAFVANLGSLGMPAGHHHLFEWGNCPIFVTLGSVHWKSVATETGVQPLQVLPLRITYDERIDDGLTAREGLRRIEEILSDPKSHLVLESR